MSLRAGGTIFAALLPCVRHGHARREQQVIVRMSLSRRAKEIIVIIMNGALAGNTAVITAAVINNNNSYQASNARFCRNLKCWNLLACNSFALKHSKKILRMKITKQMHGFDILLFVNSKYHINLESWSLMLKKSIIKYEI